MKCAREIVHQCLRSGVAMRLEQNVNVRVAAGTGRSERRPNFSRMMAVIVDDGDSTRGAANRKTPVDAGESVEPFADGRHGNVQFQARGHRGGGVQHVVRARNMQSETAEIALVEFEMKFEI